MDIFSTLAVSADGVCDVSKTRGVDGGRHGRAMVGVMVGACACDYPVCRHMGMVRGKVARCDENVRTMRMRGTPYRNHKE